MITKLKKWGNSLGIRVPKKIRELVNLKAEDELSVSVEDGKIILSQKEGTVLINCLDCETTMVSTGTVNNYYQYECPNCKALIRSNKKRHIGGLL
jgi:AbrB family looped-hinge helix DNA binding protein